MKAKELLEALQQLPPEHLDLEVYGYCNHAQTPEKICSPQIVWRNEDDTDFGYCIDEETANEWGCNEKAILL